MRNGFPKVYRSFEEFEREELHKLDTSAAIDDMLEQVFTEGLDFEAPARGGRAPRGGSRRRAETFLD